MDPPGYRRSLPAVPYLPPMIEDDFSTDPRTLPDTWKLRGKWRWRVTDDLDGRLLALPLARDLGYWLPDLLTEGKVSARVRLLSTLDGKPPRAGVVFGRQPDTGAYRYVLLKAGNPGKVILGQRKTIGALETGVVARAAVPLPRKTWMLLEVEVLEEGGADVYLDGSLVLSVDASALPPAGPGQVGLRSVKSRAFFDDFSFSLVDRLPPTACFTTDNDSPLRGESVRFDASCSASAQNRAIVSWEWDFDYDGTFTPEASGPVAYRAFLAAGARTVALRVTDDDLWPLTGLSTLPVTVEPDPPPTACFQVNTGPVMCGEPALLDAACSAHDSPLRTIVSWEWDLDYDGIFAADTAGESALVTYGSTGTYMTALRVTDDASPPTASLVVHQVDVGIVNTEPIADAGGPYLLTSGADLALDATSSADPDEACGDAVVAWEWDLDNDGFHDDAAGETVTLGWGEVESLVCGGSCLPGTDYPLSLRVTDFLGATGVQATLVTIAALDFRTCVSCHSGSPPAGFELAPNVMTYWQSGGHGDPRGLPAATCTGSTGCHDEPLLNPAGPGSTHWDGVRQGKSSHTANTYNLRGDFIAGAPANPWDVQVTLDTACAGLCHAGWHISDMRHCRDSDPAANAVMFGTHLTRTDGDAIPYPIDSDLSSLASAEEPDFAVCVSCHDPHGSGVVEDSRPGNSMLRDNWIRPGRLCVACHI